MRKEYQDELNELKSRMEKAEKFAVKIPVFSEIILRDKISGDEPWRVFGNRYKKIYLSWGINRGFYRNGDCRTITNYPNGKEYCQHLFNIYINTVSLFDEHNNFDLYKYLKDVDIFFTDEINSTFYVADESIEAFLEALNTWYCDAAEKLRIYKLQQQQIELKKKLEETQRDLGENAA